VAGTCGYGEGLSGSINAGNFLTSGKVYCQLLKMDSAPRSKTDIQVRIYILHFLRRENCGTEWVSQVIPQPFIPHALRLTVP
jgi:hypothetical protein